MINTINSRIQDLRKKLRINQGMFGHYLGLGQSTISKLETENTIVNEHYLLSIETAFNVNSQWLRHGIGEMGDISLPDERKSAYPSQNNRPDLRAPGRIEYGTAPEETIEREISSLPPNTVRLITMAIDVLRSRTHYADSLEKNIRSFHRSVALERVASEREQRLEERVDQLEREIRRIAHLGPPGEHAEPFPPPGAPEKSGPQDARPERGPGSSTE